jgi:hypothetical protein
VPSKNKEEDMTDSSLPIADLILDLLRGMFSGSGVLLPTHEAQVRELVHRSHGW